METKSKLISEALTELTNAPRLVHYSIHSPSVYETAEGERYVDKWVFGGLFTEMTGDFTEVVAVEDSFDDALLSFIDKVMEHVERYG